MHARIGVCVCVCVCVRACAVLRIHSDMRHPIVELGTLTVDHAAWLHTVRTCFQILGACLNGFAMHMCVWMQGTFRPCMPAVTGATLLGHGCREKWLFRPAMSPEQCANEPEAACVSETLPNPLRWRPMPRSEHDYEMVEGIVRVFSDASRELQLFAPPGDSFEFFSDMHR